MSLTYFPQVSLKLAEAPNFIFLVTIWDPFQIFRTPP